MRHVGCVNQRVTDVLNFVQITNFLQGSSLGCIWNWDFWKVY